MNRGSDASVSFSAKDNLSESIVGMKSSVTSFKKDVTELQKTLDKMDSTRFQLKNVDLKNAQRELSRTKKAFDELGDAATDADRAAAKADFEKASQNYENVRRQLDLVSKQARQTEKDMLDATGAISKMDNRASRSGSSGVLSALGKAGLGQMAGDAVMELTNTLIGSAFGQETGTLLSSGLSGAVSGAAMGSLAGPIGTAVGAAVGGALGLVSGASQNFANQDESFKNYYGNVYDTLQQSNQDALTAGSATAGQRELDAIAFNRLLGSGVGDQYLSDLRDMAAATPMEYSDLTGMSRALATGFGDSPQRMLALMQAIGDAGSAVGVSASDMTEMARAMSRMHSSGKASLEFLNIFQDRGVDVIGMLGDAMGKTQGQIYTMISKGKINGQDAAAIIQRGMESTYSGAMELMAKTFEGLTSTLEDTMTEINNAKGDGYNQTKKTGYSAEIDAYDGALGEVLKSVNFVSGETQARMENLADQYKRDALSAVLLGETPSYLFDDETKSMLQDMRNQFSQASMEYEETGSLEAGLKMEDLRDRAIALSQDAYGLSDQMQAVHDAELDQIEALRRNTEALGAWKNEQEIYMARTKGRGSGLASEMSSMGMTAVPTRMPTSNQLASALAGKDSGYNPYPHAYGLNRVPYDGYAALLHEGERVLTAREARSQDQSGGAAPVMITGNSFVVRQDGDIDAIAEALWRKVKLAGQGGARD